MTLYCMSSRCYLFFSWHSSPLSVSFFFFNDTATTEIYTLSLHDALPICFSAGVVISASHNPFHDNGVKLFSHAGMKFPDAVEEELEDDIFKHRGEPTPKNSPRLTADESLDAEYLEFLRKRLIPGAKLAGFRIV